ncbi:MAG TPA: glycoside hydrolase family 95 protein, partial [Tepidisphaeraceae bacterium]|nr:glycoside hydrolase family 95 protein [Tepidisphaeraceae bacterium]
MRRTFLAFIVAIFFCTGIAHAAENDLRLWYTKPARQWEEALPIGNGRMGAMVFGGVADERIQFNEDTLWTGKPHDYVREGAGDVLEQIRDLVFAGKDKEAAAIAKAKFLSDPVRQMAYQPFGDLRFHFPDHDAASDYHRELDLTTAIARTSYRVGEVQYTRETFASYPDQVIVTRLTSSKPGSLTFTLKMDSPHKVWKNQTMAPDTLALMGKVQDDGLSFESRLRVIHEGGAASISDGLISVANANSVTLLLAAATSFKNFQDITANPAERCGEILSKLEHKSYDAILADHTADYSALFNRVKLDLGRTGPADLATNERIQRINKTADPKLGAAGTDGLPADPALAALYFQMGRYMLISTSRPGSQPANLQGNWNELLSPPWESKWTTNI